MPVYRFAGDQLRAAREGAGKTREELATDIERSESLITLYELGYRQPPLEKVAELADVLGVPVEAFFTVEVPA